MKLPTFVRPLDPGGRQALRDGLRSPDAFTLRRSLILPASADGQKPKAIASAVGCCAQSVRNAFRAEGLDCLHEKSSAPKTTGPALDAAGCRRLRDLLRCSPRDFGKPTGAWALALAAEVAQAEGLTGRPVSIELIRQAPKRLGVGWKRAKDWITSPDRPTRARRGARPADPPGRVACRPGARLPG